MAANSPEGTQQDQVGQQAPEQSAAKVAEEATLSDEESKALVELYWNLRLVNQLEYYQARANEYEQNVDAAFRLGAVLMTTSSFLASLGVVLSNEPIWAPLLSLLTAIIPAIVSYVAAFRQLYQWDNQLSLYRDTQLNLEAAKIKIPIINSLENSAAPEALLTLVDAVEQVLEQEVAQWGQIALGTVDSEEADDDFDALLRTQFTNASGELNQEAYDEAKKILDAAKETPEFGQYNLIPDEIPDDSALIDQRFYDAQAERRRANAEIALKASQTLEAINSQPDIAPLELPPAPEDSGTSVDNPESSAGTPSSTTGIQDNDISVDEEASSGDSPVGATDPGTLVADDSTVDDSTTTGGTEIEQDGDELPDVPAERQLSATDDESVSEGTTSPSPSTININQESVNIADNVVIGGSNEDVPQVDDSVNDEPEPTLPDESTLSQQFGEPDVTTNDFSDVEEIPYDTFTVDDVSNSDTRYDDDSDDDDSGIEVIDDY